MRANGKKALVLFSGGQDSTTCLAWALREFAAVETLGFAYGQRHRNELDARPGILERLGNEFPAWRETLGEDHLLSLDVLSQIGGSALTDDVAIAMRADGLPTSFVPGRNLMFLTAAAALGTRRGIYDLVGGMCETDYSGYPDCRGETIEAMQKALTLGFAEEFIVHTPLMRIDKCETWRLAEDLEIRAGQEFFVLADRNGQRHISKRVSSLPICRRLAQRPVDAVRRHDEDRRSCDRLAV